MSVAAPELRQAASILGAARHAIVFTGAGVSAESGIPTYRGQDGLWRRYDPYQVASIKRFRADPTRYWEVALERARDRQAEPNPAHRAIAALQDAGHVTAVVTQNTDGLHQRAGSRQVLELHGNSRWVRCLDCGAVEPRPQVQARLERELPPRCLLCRRDRLKPTVIFFGEPLPQDVLRRSFELAEYCDAMLCVGSSLVVHPAADIPWRAIRHGAPVIVCNDEPTPLDPRAEVVLRGRAGELLPELVSLLVG
ncbi:MAG: Sir2 family NAD-dependent protein deacetylase [Candidatus Dormibacteraeota bacterium]|nr:Sir2 family NAD-dependent protein deacetylase [Candidatus Dormibacteraeota bacterium]MBO0745973.1 Sir2 family NAD-dependent protein deacetylase [Candidatus Dormibacteraeota bacterium]